MYDSLVWHSFQIIDSHEKLNTSHGTHSFLQLYWEAQHSRCVTSVGQAKTCLSQTKKCLVISPLPLDKLVLEPLHSPSLTTLWMDSIACPLFMVLKSHSKSIPIHLSSKVIPRSSLCHSCPCYKVTWTQEGMTWIYFSLPYSLFLWPMTSRINQKGNKENIVRERLLPYLVVLWLWWAMSTM